MLFAPASVVLAYGIVEIIDLIGWEKELKRKIAERKSRIYELEELQNSDDDEEMGDREI